MSFSPRVLLRYPAHLAQRALGDTSACGCGTQVAGLGRPKTTPGQREGVTRPRAPMGAEPPAPAKAQPWSEWVWGQGQAQGQGCSWGQARGSGQPQ